MLEICKAIGPENWVSQGDAIARREAMQDIFFDYALCPEQTEEEWPEDRQLYSEMVVVDGSRLVGTAMLVLDPEREDIQLRVFGVGLLPEYRTDFIISALEEQLIKDSYLDDSVPFIEGADGRLITNPAADIEGIPARPRRLAA
ncbi:hypothetical protein [Pacificibacter marinus]|jgi:hypothetical protein|uniref:N-acetyltransferase domain-containing protein n=1 Tax=Pacificibacter marinus TaxID=658057 RepID=A0A1Y5SQC0_9RHOB|nr:hypothetical protein [Pacificibacter marinus]SEK68615.1 hypothetical protein SAMN04488032_105107 [Pacificibacter marinus]SLN45837.1 hypothetical protein PAM7971_02218 [Pacificibacter marinus]